MLVIFADGSSDIRLQKFVKKEYRRVAYTTGNFMAERHYHAGDNKTYWLSEKRDDLLASKIEASSPPTPN